MRMGKWDHPSKKTQYIRLFFAIILIFCYTHRYASTSEKRISHWFSLPSHQLTDLSGISPWLWAHDTRHGTSTLFFLEEKNLRRFFLSYKNRADSRIARYRPDQIHKRTQACLPRIYPLWSRRGRKTMETTLVLRSFRGNGLCDIGYYEKWRKISWACFVEWAIPTRTEKIWEIWSAYRIRHSRGIHRRIQKGKGASLV